MVEPKSLLIKVYLQLDWIAWVIGMMVSMLVVILSVVLVWNSLVT
jgi:hypothetical protein